MFAYQNQGMSSPALALNTAGNWNAGGGVGMSYWGRAATSVSTAGTMAGGSVVSAYQQQQHYSNPYQPFQPEPQQQQQKSTLQQNTNNVSLYTQYYHEWKAIADSPASTPSEKEWATYYADLASRAAHYYHQNPNTSQPPAQDLPPAPPGSTAAHSQPPAVAVNSDIAQQQQHGNPNLAHHQTAAGNTNPDTSSFQVYVDKCLHQCRTPQEKDEMIAATKSVLQTAIREGRLHKIDWSREPLISLPRSTATSAPSPVPASSTQVERQVTKADFLLKKHGHAAVHKKAKTKNGSSKKTEKISSAKKRSYRESPTTVQGSYYGPSESSFLPFSSSPAGSSKKLKSVKETGGFNASSDSLNRRAQRFANSFQQSSSDMSEGINEGGGDVVVGLCQVLEKEYLRLTSAPKPELVRPQPILEKHFNNLKSEYRDLKRRRDYLWFCSQLKAIRQDCTVQHLKNDFCVLVYEFHAKVALENGDINEFNQCQTQLKYLYPVLKGSAQENRSEFLSYRILYAVYLNLHNDKATIDMKDILGQETISTDPIVKHALDVLSAAQGGDYQLFFARLYPSKYSYQNYFLEKMVPIFRLRALECICSAYRPTVEVSFVCKTLQISESEWLKKVGCVLDTVTSCDGEIEVIKTKESQIKEPDNNEKSSKLM